VSQLGPGAWIILLQAAATYAAAGSSYYLLRPLLRGQEIDRLTKVVASGTSTDPAVAAFAQRVGAILTGKQADEAKRARRENWIGSALLGLSVVLFSAAFAVQVGTDQAFQRPGGPAARQEAPPGVLF
jgi:hypothetical protein